MKTLIIALLLVTGIRPALHAREVFPFTSTTTTTAAVTNFTVVKQGQKFVMTWTITQNQEADRFELEKSSDGKHFTTAALIFGTDKTDTDNYAYFEKLVPGKKSYRLKVIHKDQTVEFSEVLTVK